MADDQRPKTDDYIESMESTSQLAERSTDHPSGDQHHGCRRRRHSKHSRRKRRKQIALRIGVMLFVLLILLALFYVLRSNGGGGSESYLPSRAIGLG